MRIDVLTLFPEMIESALSYSIVGRARERSIVDIHTANIREFALGNYRQVDDTPYGGGPGLVLRCEPVFASVRKALAADPVPAHMILLTPKGRPMTQATARELAAKPRLLMLCGHYEGIDERIRTGFPWDEISLGDFVLTGGEIAALAVIDAVTRLLPGAIGDETGTADESFENGLLEYPHYTRPPVYEGQAVPDILLSGHHAEIAKWRRRQSEALTRARRPDLWRRYLDAGNRPIEDGEQTST